MSRGLTYETGWDMPPGMAEKAAVKIAQSMQATGGVIPPVAAAAPEEICRTSEEPVAVPAVKVEQGILISAPRLVDDLIKRISPMVLKDSPADAIFKEVVACIADAPAVEVEHRRWIPVEERKPDAELQLWREDHPTEPLQVLVAIRGAREATILSYDEDGGFFAIDDYGDVDYCNVTHWQPVPAVPEVQK